jgi:hypothetical protein
MRRAANTLKALKERASGPSGLVIDFQGVRPETDLLIMQAEHACHDISPVMLYMPLLQRSDVWHFITG